MKQVFISLYALYICIFTIHPLTATEIKDMQQVKNDLRIFELLPNLLCPLAVDPCIPIDFIAGSPNGKLDPYDWIYWGPKEVMKAYFENPDSLDVPLLRVKLSANVAQTGPKSFNGESSSEFLNQMKKTNPKGFAAIETKWGDYPVLSVRNQIEKQLILMAWVGLNVPEGGWTLMFNLVYPNKNGHPNIEDRQLWENLITKTTQLSDRDFFKACGQDLQDGYTLVNVGGAKLKMVAEKRQSDGALQVVVIPESSDVEFHYVDMTEGLMGAKWKYGEPIVKVYGEIVYNNGDVEAITDHVTSIFLKTVTEFSFKKEDGNNLLIFQKPS